MTPLGILEIRIDNLTKTEIEKKISGFLLSEKFHWLVTLNPEIVLRAWKSISYGEILNLSDLNIVDGVGLEYTNLLLGKETIKCRYPGVDLINFICLEAEKNNQTIMLFGGQEKFSNNKTSAEICALNLTKKFPNLKIVIENGGLIRESDGKICLPADLKEKVKKNNVKILLAALSNPMQEKFVFSLKNEIPELRLAVGVGGSFNLLSGFYKRAPLWMQSIGLEWLWRLFTKPGHLKRVLRAVLVFPSIVIYRNFMPRYIPKVLAFIINKNGKVLVAQRAQSLPEIYWQLPKGTVAENENLEQALRREIYEEVGLSNFGSLYLCPKTQKYNFPKNKFRLPAQGAEVFCWLLKFSGEENEVRLDNHELVNYKWVEINELQNIISKERHNTLNICLKYLDRLK